jgi:hypothetical protein
VPGNHERSRIPHERFAEHPNIHIFRDPTTFRLLIRGTRVALSGFPYHRKAVRKGFPELLRETGWHQEEADLRLLCVHHCVEGATVGPSDHTFRNAPDVIRASDLPGNFAAVLSGHIHRHQILRRDLQGRSLDTPVYYSGSVERTAFAEIGEEKGYLILEAVPGPRGGRTVRERFVGLPARPMEMLEISPDGGPGAAWAPGQLTTRLMDALASVPPDAVLQIRIRGTVPRGSMEEISAAALREVAPGEMNLQLLLEGSRPRGRTGGHRSRGKGPSPTPVQHFLEL